MILFSPGESEKASREAVREHSHTLLTLAVRLDKLIGEGDSKFFQRQRWACKRLNDAILALPDGISNTHLGPTQTQTHSISLRRRLIQYSSVPLH